jgi:signal transduction histidine kinase
VLGADMASGFVGVPLVTGGKVVGLLAVVLRAGVAPSEDDEWLLSALADQVAAPLESARLATQLERSALLADNVRLFEAERTARLAAESAQRDAELARDVAIQADTTKSLFLAAMSHELRTPLNAIGGYVDLLQLGLRGPLTSEQSHDLARIKASQDHLLRLINDVLEYARLGNAETELRVDDVDLDAVLRETETMILPQTRAKGVRYDYTACAGPAMVRADAHRLKQIVLNLLTNAIKYTDPGGSIRMTCGVEGTLARVDVQDSGRGIPAEYIDTIWQPFVQVGRRLNQPGEGVGLGLAISRDLARRIGGELSVTSTLDRGSTFTLTIPLAHVG